MSDESASFTALALDAHSVLILKALLAAGEDFVSGSLLAEQLEISRPAVHGKLDKLRDEGFGIEAVRNRGYRIVKMPERIHPALLRCRMDENGSRAGLHCYAAIDSTNSEAERRIASGEASPFVVVSSCQTRGRGRLGRVWHSRSTDNLYLSVLFEPNIPPQQLQHFTLWAGICICQKLQSFLPDAPLKVKWPNDLHCEGRKFAGMLTEAKMDADSIRSIVFGLGLNVNSNPNSFPEEIRHLATSLRAISGRVLELNTLAAAVIRAIEEAYAICIENTDTSKNLEQSWRPLDALAGRPVTAILKGEEITGIAGGIDENGSLIIEMPDGRKEAIRAGDVTLKK